MTISDIADYCALKDCTVTLGDPAIGFIDVDGGGNRSRSNFARFLSLNELSALPSPLRVVEDATSFRVSLGRGTRTLSRVEFEKELRTLREKVGS